MESKRLRLRAMTEEDAPLLISWYKEAELMKHVGFDDGLIVSLDEQIKRIKEQKIDEKLLMLTLLDDTPIGECHYLNIKGSSCEIGIKIGDLSYQGQGYGKEGLQLLLAHLFGVLGMKSIFLDTLEENVRAQNLYKTVGFKQTGINPNIWTDPKGRPRSAVLMTLTIDDFRIAMKQPFKIV